MKRLLALFAFALVGASPAAPNWVGTVALGANGAYVMGNPKAKVRLVEYISYTCGHCAHFVEEAAAPLKRDFVAKGLVAVEFRNAVRDQFDMTAALAARCGGAGRFFGNSEALLAAQSEWLGKAQGFITAKGAALQKMTPVAGMQAIAKGVGIDSIMAKRGFTPVQISSCIASGPAQKQVVGLAKLAWEVDKISGTPAFIVNGTQLTNAGHWPVVEGSLKAALGVD